MDLVIQKIPGLFSVCQINKEQLAFINWDKDYVFLSSTPQELSLVCETHDVPLNCIAAENGWQLLKIDGILDFSLVGIIARISGILAEASISLFVVSTYNTDYILVKKERIKEVAFLLEQNGYLVQ